MGDQEAGERSFRRRRVGHETLESVLADRVVDAHRRDVFLFIAVFLLVAVVGVPRPGECLRDAGVGACPMHFRGLLRIIKLELLLRDARGATDALGGAARKRGG